MTYLGITETEIESNHKVANTKFYAVKQAPHNLLGIPEIMALGLLARVRGLRVEERHQELYRGLGQLTEKFKIKLKKGAEPFSLFVPRRLPIGLREATLREFQKMENLGVIEMVKEYREWCAGMVVAPKTNGDVRICVDLTKLNKSVKRENFPLPRVEEILVTLEGSRVFF